MEWGGGAGVEKQRQTYRQRQRDRGTICEDHKTKTQVRRKGRRDEHVQRTRKTDRETTTWDREKDKSR